MDRPRPAAPDDLQVAAALFPRLVPGAEPLPRRRIDHHGVRSAGPQFGGRGVGVGGDILAGEETRIRTLVDHRLPRHAQDNCKSQEYIKAHLPFASAFRICFSYLLFVPTFCISCFLYLVIQLLLLVLGI